jgi:hypothetical protein
MVACIIAPYGEKRQGLLLFFCETGGEKEKNVI